MFIFTAPGQGFSTAPFQLRPDVDLKYVNGNYIAPPSGGKTNWYRIQNLGLQYGDRIRIRPVGTFAVKNPGDTEFGSDEAQPFLGFFTGVMTRPNSFYHPSPLVDSGAPRYVTPPADFNGSTVATDVELDFLIPLSGVTVCVPAQGNFLALLNPDPRVRANDPNNDFRIEVSPLEGARVERLTLLDAPEVTVGDPVGLTITFTNSGNVSAFLQMFDNGRGEVRIDSNLIARVSGPFPSGSVTISPGGFDTIEYTFRAVGPGTNIFNPEIGQTVCGDQFYSVGARFASVVIKPVIEITPRQPSLEVYSEESVAAGGDDADAPLRFTESETSLVDAAAFGGRGLVADGVTPLLFRLEIPPAKLDRFESEVSIHVEASLISGEVLGAPIEERLEIFSNGEWVSNGEARISKSKPIAHAALKPFRSDDLKFAAGQVELTLQLEVHDDTGLTLGRTQIPIRRPPVTLIHGYNTGGDWGDDFLKRITDSRGVSFVQVVRYGQDETGGPNGSEAQINTLWPLKNLAPLAERAFDESLVELRKQWIFTRHDVIAHSQGGLLTRMLCSQNANRHLPLPYRNEENFYRGRFHRVVTIGSPHNGTRLLRYLLALNQNEGDAIPSWVGYAMVGSSIAQPKFDPWGGEIFDLTDDNSAADWAPDIAAQFHLVQTSVNGGLNYAADPTMCPSLWALGIDTPEAGDIVANQGSDGVVDYASMFAVGPFVDEPENSYSVSAANRISHAFYAVPGLGEAFGAESGQVLSTVVAEHVIGALDQNPVLPASERIFGPFKVPPQLGTDIRDRIDELARSFDSKAFDPQFVSLAPSPANGIAIKAAGASASTFTRRLTPPNGFLPADKVYWTAYLLTTNGIDTHGLTMIAQQDPLEVRVQVASGIFGDVVLEGIYDTATGTRVILKPSLLASLTTPGVTAESIEIIPRDSARHPGGIQVPVEVWTTWSDGRKSRRFVSAQGLQVTSSAPTVVDVSNPLIWRTKAAGEATLTIAWEGRSATAHWTIFDADAGEQPLAALRIESATASGIQVSWPMASGNGFQLQVSDRLGPGAIWQNVNEVVTEQGDRFLVTLPLNPSTHFYRLQK